MFKIKRRSAKNKGAKFQNEIALELANTFDMEYGTDKDFKGRTMGNSGTDIVMSTKARKECNYDIECKCQETWSIPNWWQQAKSNTEENRNTLLLIKKNHHEPLAVIDFKHFLELISKDNNISKKSNNIHIIEEIKELIKKL